MSAAVLGLALVVLALVTIFRKRVARPEVYGNFHVELNHLPGDKRGCLPSTQWMNMGYWKDTLSFPRACEDLALKTIEAAHCVKGGHVLDVGHGSGDSLLLHLTHPSVQKPATLTGITNVQVQHAEAARRAQEALQSEPSIKLELHLGDAVYQETPVRPTILHPLDPSNPAPKFTSILAIDCAYHFRTRRQFLVQCFDRLAPGGQIALADMCLAPLPSTAASLLTKIISQSLSVPAINLGTIEEYEACLKEIGYVEVEIEDVTLDVFPRFIGFLTSKGSRELGTVWWLMGKVFLLWWKGCGARYVLVSAKKPA